MKKILIVEDDMVQLDGIAAILNQIDNSFEIYKSRDSSQAIHISQTVDIDLFILDVDLSITNSVDSGIDIGINLRHSIKYKNTPIIYITSIPEKIHTAVNDVHCFNYITKPYSPESILSAINDIKRLNKKENESLKLQDIYGVTISLKFDRILYIQTEGHIRKFHTLDGVFSIRTKSLKDLTLSFPDNFVQIHKSFIVNLCYINTYDKTLYKISLCKKTLPVGRSYKNNLNSRFIKETP